MTVGELIVYLVIALICGLLGQMLAGRSVGGYIVTTVIGIIGAFLGTFIARSIGAPEPFLVIVGGRGIPVLWAIIGAALVTFLVVFLRRVTARKAR